MKTLPLVLLALAASVGAQTQTHKLSPDDPTPHEWFADVAVDVGGGVAICGKYLDDVGGLQDRGSAYLFDVETGAQLFKLVAPDGEVLDRFGFAVATDGVRAVVGAPYHNDRAFQTGAAYLFDVATGNLLHKLIPNDLAREDTIGASVAIEGNFVVVSAALADANGSNSGAAYVFDAGTGQQLHKLLPGDGEANDKFGSPVDIDQKIVILGARGDDDNGVDAGAAYLFDAATGCRAAQARPGRQRRE